jgi:hypothetical protein
MEYRLRGGTTWTPCTGTSVTGLAAGFYEVRLKATTSAFAGQTAPVTTRPVQFFKFSVETTAAGETFYLPSSGSLNGYNTAKTYDWTIDWGDGSSIQNVSGSSAPNSPGIGHTYAAAGTWQITIRPHGSDPESEDAWLGAFGFNSNTSGANIQANKNMVVSVDSPIHPLMTRTQAQLTSGEAPTDEWADTFYYCQNAAFTMGEGFRFSDEWDSITTVGDGFADFMFSFCSGAAFTMNEVFNLPQGITTVGADFAVSMFSWCSGAGFTMNDVFNLPQGITTAGNSFASAIFRKCSGEKFTMNEAFNLPEGITTAGNSFASSMFDYCDGEGFTMNEVFNLPQGITTVGSSFAFDMFRSCSGAAFTMNSGFNLPQGITTVGGNFAISMFSGCSGAAFTMNEAFNLPQGITTAGNYFVYDMFYNCSGAEFLVNAVFKFPKLNTIPSEAFGYTFSLGSDVTKIQTRTAASIINGNARPSSDRYTFSPAAAWTDYSSIDANWR